MAYKHKITTSIPFDSDTPNIALDSVIDFITSKFIADTPALSVTKEIAYDAEAYKGFPVFSGEKYSGGFVPVSKIVFLGKHTDSLGLLLFCTQNGIYYDLHICIMPSFDMLCVTPATYGENYQSSANACKYIYRMLRGWPDNRDHFETRLTWNVTPGDSGMINMNIVSAGSADYGYAYIINSGNTSYTQFHIGFVRQGESALSMWWKNNNAGLFDIDYQYPLKAGVFSPKTYNTTTYYTNLADVIADTTGMDYLNDDIAHKIILIGQQDGGPEWVTCGLHQFFLGNNSTLLSSYRDRGDFGCMQPTLENLAGGNKAKSYELWSGESLPHLTGEQIFLRQLMQPLSLVAFTSVYRLALASLTTPRAGTVYTTDTGTYITLLDNCVTYALKLN